VERLRQANQRLMESNEQLELDKEELEKQKMELTEDLEQEKAKKKGGFFGILHEESSDTIMEGIEQGIQTYPDTRQCEIQTEPQKDASPAK